MSGELSYKEAIPDSPRVGVRFQIVQGWGLRLEYIAVPPYHTASLTLPTAIQLKSHPHYFLERIPYIIEKDVSKGYSKSYDVEVIVPFWDNSGMLISITKYFNPLLLVCPQETHVDNSP